MKSTPYSTYRCHSLCQRLDVVSPGYNKKICRSCLQVFTGQYSLNSTSKQARYELCLLCLDIVARTNLEVRTNHYIIRLTFKHSARHINLKKDVNSVIIISPTEMGINRLADTYS